MNEGWRADGGKNIQHVYPLGDLREHVMSVGCWCHPGHEEVDGGLVIIHNSLDGREAFERGERRPS